MKSPRERTYHWRAPDGDPETLRLPISVLNLDPRIKRRLIAHPTFETLGDLVSYPPQHYAVFVVRVGRKSIPLIEAALEEFNLILPPD